MYLMDEGFWVLRRIIETVVLAGGAAGTVLILLLLADLRVFLRRVGESLIRYLDAVDDPVQEEEEKLRAALEERRNG
ncbi:hypothetical protein [Bacilliculturomica massiliensis]|uniref:hypothetical protein n=1 Tax=Bacilliculturomica massiliensis TaxID=1917867 RepID=UPI001030D8FB|nr:hypothetical protein [Bacilliculturomica massiliensis]